MLDFIRVILDFGIGLFLWSVQLIYLPSLKWVEGEQLRDWTAKYFDRALAFMMIWYPIHLCVIFLQLYFDQNLFTVASALLVAVIWTIAIKVIAPKMRKIVTGKNLSIENRNKIYQYNWLRSITIIISFVWSFLYFLKKYPILLD